MGVASNIMPVRDEPSYQARCFGRFGIFVADGSDVTPVGRKARALLARLILAEGEPIARERLAAWLWPDRGEEQARASLRQTLYELRTFVGGDAPLLITGRALIRIDATRIDSDIGRLRRATDAGDAGVAADMIGEQPQDLLADLDGIDPAYDDWLAIERTHLRDERQRRISALATAALAAGDSAVAARLAGSLMAADPTDEAAAVLAMQAAHARGERDGILKIHARHGAALARLLDLPPSPAVTAAYARLIETSAVSSALSRQASARPDAVRRTAPHMLSRSHRIGIVVLLTCIVAALGWWTLRRNMPAGQKLMVVERLKVAPGDAAARGLRRDLANDLARTIVGTDATLGVADPDDRVGAGNRKADFRVTGEADSDGGMLHATVRLLQQQDSTILWSNSFARPIPEGEALRQDIATHVADVMGCALGGHYPTPTDIDTESTRLYLAACEQKHADWAQSAKLLNALVRRRPDFAHAWAMLAAATASVAGTLPDDVAAPEYRRADTFARKALALDPRDGEAFYARAMAQYGADLWEQQMTLLMAGHAVDPENSPVNASIAWNLAMVGRSREAAVFARHAADHDPFSPWDTAQVAELLTAHSQTDQATDMVRMMARRWPANKDVAYSAFAITARTGDPVKATAILADRDRVFPLDPHEQAVWEAFLIARRSPTSRHIDAAAQIASAPAAASEYLIDHVADLVQLGRLDAAYRLIAVSKPAPSWTNSLLFYDFMAPFRSDPRFMEMAARQGLVGLWKRTSRWPDFCNDKSPPYNCRAVANRL